MRRIKIFDTTLRDGEQSPGASMNVDEKIQVARQLKKLGVDIIEAGFPIASPGDFEAVNRIAKEVKGVVVAGLCRARDEDIERAAEALAPAEQKRIHTFIATSDIHLKYKLRMNREQVIEAAVKAVKKARQYTDDVEFSAEDATRSDWDYLCKVTEEVIKAGATTVNIPDTVGYTIPQEYGELIEYLMNKVPNIDKATISVHCHNDLGLAVANSLTAILKGAGQVECTINGIGERAGNAAMEEIVMALKVRGDFFKADTGIVTQELYRTSRLVSKITGMVVQPNKAIVGANAFAHEAGIHQDGVLKERTTYEIMRPQDIGIPSSKIVLGKHSGRHAFKTRLEELGFSLTEEEINRAFERFKRLADQKKYIFNEDIEALVSDEVLRITEVYQLIDLEVSSGTKKKPTATVRMKINGEEKEISISGDGPVDAVYKAITELTGSKAELNKFEIKAITGGTDALGEVTIILEEAGHTVRGHGSDTDIIVASAKAYINALNKLALKNLKS
ncbi:MAG: 2-isopropylmalate synthase [Thermodesulfovibrio sp.]|jgi:2-isopropylmalate synthase|uniref:2-isopropylmalate synthase n=1 Tax=unclassified Thermodesulfovibrio TaxID=2645936 RepID=UPI000839DBE3|nr:MULTISPECIES: 2-isopropylmalate synthase [unclassified Thermodesulfovibrio]MDI1471380.1 2-isopropylmalate synthase [Thermodesulfovibrio sp. 1176]MDI6714593.1 2-isopropylmalate synthase [Thermodesulfovibrio sp.]ODA44333.1 2-isopropylmalate synthase [Thermodesulfovibrio sp. N1]